MTQPLRILCVAQHFGFGPMAEMVAIERALRADPRGSSLKLALLDNPHLGPLVSGVRESFDLIPSAPGVSPLEALLSARAADEADAVLSSYDSAAVFFGWFCGRPTFFYDGLFWFWKFDPYRQLVPELLADLYEARERRNDRGLVDVYRRALAIDYHLTVCLAHHLATRSFVRGGRGVAARQAAFPEFRDKIQVVGAVMDGALGPSAADARNHVLVSLSGSLAPLLTLDQNLAFARGALAFALEAHKVLDVQLPWHFFCHPLLRDRLAAEGRLAGLPKGFTVEASCDYRTNLDLIARARALFVSPGFSSIQEAAYFETPVFFLPEQNGGQPAQFCMVREEGYDTSGNWTATEVLHGGQPVIGEDDVGLLYDGIDALWSDARREARLAVLRRFAAVIRDPTQTSLLVRSQRNAVTRVFGTFDGGTQIARYVLKTMSE